MKKAALLTLVVCLFICGCSNAKTVSPVTKGIKFTLNAISDESEYNVSVLIDKGGCMDATVKSPEILNGMKITANNFETSTEYKDLKYTYNEDDFAGNNLLIAVFSILSSCEKKQLLLENGENCVINDKYLGEKYEFTFSPSGLPIKLSIPSRNLEAVFSDVGVV